MITTFLFNLKQYGLEIIPSVLLGFLLSGIVHELVPQNVVNKYLGKKDILTLLRISLIGIILPVCCWGALPIAVGLRKRGVPLGPILAFLVTTPATSISAILITYQLLGLKFAIYLCAAVILMGIIIGIIGNFLKVAKEIATEDSCCPMCEEVNSHLSHRHHQNGFKSKVISILTYSFVDLPKEIGWELIIGIILAVIVATISPIGILIKKYLSGYYGYLFAVIFGLLMYICATGSVPLVAAFLNQGLNIGAGMVLLLAGPITSYGTILVIRKEFGLRVLIIYLSLIVTLSLIFGYLYNFFNL